MKLNYGRTFFVGLAFMSICTFWQVYDGIVPLILKKTFDMNETLAGGIMAIDNVLALFMLPLFGAFSDKARSRWGRRMPYIFFGTLAAVLLMQIIPLGDNMRSLPLMMVGLGLVLLAMSTYRSPAVALMPDVTAKPLRSKANAVINLMGALGGILSLGLIAVLVPKVDNPNYVPLFIATGGVMLVSLVALLLSVNEPKLAALVPPDPDTDEKQAGAAHALPPDKRRSLILILCSVFLWFFGYNAVTTAFSKYANIFWGLEGGSFAYTLMIAQGAAIVAFLPVAILSNKIGRRKTILGGIVVLAAAFATAFLFKNFSTLIFFFFALAGIGWAAINVNSYPMVVEMSHESNVGKYTGYYYTFSMLAQIITPIASGALLEYVGYWTLFPYGALFVALSFVTMLFVRHGDAKPEVPQDKLEAFSAADD